MKHRADFDSAKVLPKVWGVDDPSIVDLSDESTAIELFVDDPRTYHHHIFRFMIETPLEHASVMTEGILLGRSTSAERPKLPKWAGGSDDLQILSCINLGSGLFKKFEDEAPDNILQGHINDDPIVFLNFDPATTTARFMTSLDCVPELVRARHRESLQEYEAAA